MVFECPKKKQLPIRAASPQINLSEIDEGVEPDIDVVVAQYEDDGLINLTLTNLAKNWINFCWLMRTKK